MMKLQKLQKLDAQKNEVMVLFVREMLKTLTVTLDDIISANNERYTHLLFDLSEKLKLFPAFIDVSYVDPLLILLSRVTHELADIIKHATHANYFLDKDELNVYAAFKLIEALEVNLVHFEKNSCIN